MRKKILYVAALVAFVFIAMSLRPVSHATMNNCIRVEGTVVAVEEKGGPGDVVITLQNDPHVYYINRGLLNGLTIDELQETLEREEATLYFVDHWSPLDPTQHTCHLARVEQGGDIVFNEMEH